ncbi:MAG: hypothetical protein ABSC18_12940 [Verrucomicrobiota bacterium]|jgi:hypothetical protein
MTTTQTPTTTTTDPSSKPGSPGRWRYLLTGLVVFAATIALFYVEENWRGRRAWENCKRELEAKGAHLDWSYYIPPPVPDDQNVFGVPEMQQWFEGRMPTELAKWLSGSPLTGTNSASLVLANLTIGLPGAIPPSGSVVLSWADTANTPAEASRLIQQALGPVATDPLDPTQSCSFMARKPEELRPIQIFLQCQTAPTEQDLNQLLLHFSSHPKPIVKLEPSGGNSYQVTMLAPTSAADYVARFDKNAPDLAVVRQALQRPYARLAGDYRIFDKIPIRAIVSIRTVSQRLAALAECYLLLGQPEKALDALTFMHQLCRALEAHPTGRPSSLVAAMINVAVTGLYASTIEDGMRLHAWKEPQLAALQEQLEAINLRPDVRNAMSFEQAFSCLYAETTPLAELVRLYNSSGKPAQRPGFSFWSLIPRGWVYQNMVVSANLHQMINEEMFPAGPLVVPHEIESAGATVDREVSASLLWSPFKLLAEMSTPGGCVRAARTTAYNQTMVNQAQIVCALERYHLARGEYPATLENLVPEYIQRIPPDLIGGQPPHYRRTEDGKFLLYSIGWTEKDHGGQSGSNVMKDGDWVWGEFW